jgi:hypothetical protein
VATSQGWGLRFKLRPRKNEREERKRERKERKTGSRRCKNREILPNIVKQGDPEWNCDIPVPVKHLTANIRKLDFKWLI